MMIDGDICPDIVRLYTIILNGCKDCGDIEEKREIGQISPCIRQNHRGYYKFAMEILVPEWIAWDR